MKFLLLIAALGAACLGAAPPGAAELAAELRQAGLDPDACYRVRELNFSKEDARFYLTAGYLMFAKPVAGRRFGAVFTAETEGGDAELLLMPPTRSERASLALFAKSPNLAEHFRLGALIFTDNTGDELLKEVEERGFKKSAEAGVLLSQGWNPLLHNLMGSFEVRLVRDALSPTDLGFFYAAVNGNTLGNFDLLYDPRAREQITVGQLTHRDERVFFDTWASFESRSFRSGRRTRETSEFDISDFRIDLTVQPDLKVTATTRLRLSPRTGAERAFAFDISKRVRITSAKIDGQPAEVFQRESFRAALLRGGDNDMFLLVAPSPLEKNKQYEIEFTHEGDVVTRTGAGIFFVESRANWYPHRNLQFAKYDLTFRYPKELTLVSTGEVVDENEEGLQRITRRRTDSPVRMAGFNLGDFQKAEVSRSGLRVEVYANRKLDPALQPKRDVVLLQPSPFPRPQRRLTPDLYAVPLQMPPPSPTARLQKLAEDVTAAFEFMSQQFGPPPLTSLTVSPIPGTFGQGFPGLVYLSTLSYLEPRDRPAMIRSADQQTFFSEVLSAHETAHQWWGNVVTAPNYQDDWVMESLANYSALMFLEKRKGPHFLESILESYREHLLEKRSDGATIESTGPVSWGIRLNSSHSPGAWRTITYEKGSWVLHMLRRRMGDEAFLRMMAELPKRFRLQPITNEQFRELAVEFLPKGSSDPDLSNFFDQWVYGTGIPTLKMQYTLKGKAPNLKLSGTVTQMGVPEDFSADVPVEILTGKVKRVVWVRTSSEPVNWSAAVRVPPSKVTLDPGASVLSARR